MVGEVVYLGAATHSVVDLDAGGRLTVLQQNLETSHDPCARPAGRTGDAFAGGAPTSFLSGPPGRRAPATDLHHLEETP